MVLYKPWLLSHHASVTDWQGQFHWVNTATIGFELSNGKLLEEIDWEPLINPFLAEQTWDEGYPKAQNEVLVLGLPDCLQIQLAGQALQQPFDGLLSPQSKQRARYAGKMSRAYLKGAFPGLPDDCQNAYFQRGPRAQQLAFKAGDAWKVTSKKKVFSGFLPAYQARFFDLKGSVFSESTMRLDTLILLPTQNLGLMIWRAHQKIDHFEVADDWRCLLALETLDKTLPNKHYQQALENRTGPQALRYLMCQSDLLPVNLLKKDQDQQGECHIPEGESTPLSRVNPELEIDNEFSKHHISEETISDQHFQKSAFSDCVYSDCLFDSVTFSDSAFRSCQFLNCHWRSCRFENLRFQQCDFRFSQFEKSHFRHCLFSNTEAATTHWQNTILYHCEWLNVSVQGAFFERCHAYRLWAEAVNASWSQWFQSNCQQSTWLRSRWFETVCHQSVFQQSDWQQVLVDHCQIDAWQVSRSEFKDCLIRDSLLNDADLSRSHFEDTRLIECEANHIDMASSQWQGCELQGNSFQSANAMGVHFNYCAIDNNDWTQALLYYMKLKACDGLKEEELHYAKS